MSEIKYWGEFAKDHDWQKAKAGKQAVEAKFELPSGYLTNINILLAGYFYGSYDGIAFVLFEKDGKLFEVNGSHCSCYGLEGQWEPEEVNIKELLGRATRYPLYDKTEYHFPLAFNSRLVKILRSWE